MTFLNPFLLFGLAAAAIPILIHLLNLRKLRTVEFSSLRFLKELQKTRIRRFRIRQLLLLILRTLLVVFLVLAFSRPALRGDLAGTVGTHARSTVVIVLDDSPSMGVRNENGILLDQAKELVGRLLTIAAEGDELYLLPASETKHTDDFTRALSPHSVMDALASVGISDERVPFVHLSGSAAKILAGSGNINQEVFFVSDGQASGFRREESDSAEIFGDRPRIFFATIAGLDRGSNIGVHSVGTAAQIVSPMHPMNLDVRIQNGGPAPQDNVLVSIYLDGSRVVQQSLGLTTGGLGTITCTVIPRKPGIASGYVQLEDDLLEADNRRHFVIDVPSSIRVALVGLPEDIRFLELALSAVDEMTGHGVLSTSVVEPSRIASVNAAAFDVVILSNPETITDGGAERLARFAQGGGGLMVFPGDRTDLADLSTRLLKRLGLPPVRGGAFPEKPPAGDESAGGFLTFGSVDLAHPLFSGLFDAQHPSGGPESRIESPRIVRSVRVDPGKTGNSLVTLSDGAPFLVEYPTDAGRLLMFAVEAGVSWSDFAVKGLFSPLIHRAVSYLARGRTGSEDRIVGEPVTISRRFQSPREEAYVILTPDGMRERIIPQVNPVTGITTFSLPSTRKAGVYELSSDGQASPGASQTPVGAAVANIDPAESLLEVATSERIVSFFESIGAAPGRVLTIGGDEDVVRTVQESRYGAELWKLMLGAAFVCALAEMLVARVTKRDDAVTADEAGA